MDQASRQDSRKQSGRAERVMSKEALFSENLNWLFSGAFDSL
jgi:hypothetical protein